MKRFGAQSKGLALTAGWLVGLLVTFIRLSCRLRFHDDPRFKIVAAGENAIYATGHARQLAGSMAALPGTATMVSRSADGDFLVPGLKLARVVPIRGSSGGRNKGGATALHAMVRHLNQGHSAMIAVDGPNGPRGVVKKGIGLLARKAEAPVIPCIATPTRRWIMTKSWDRMQIPKPFSVINVYAGEPIVPEPDESHEDFAKRVEVVLDRLEALHDPEEAPKPASELRSRVEPRIEAKRRRAA